MDYFVVYGVGGYYEDHYTLKEIFVDKKEAEKYCKGIVKASKDEERWEFDDLHTLKLYAGQIESGMITMGKLIKQYV